MVYSMCSTSLIISYFHCRHCRRCPRPVAQVQCCSAPKTRCPTKTSHRIISQLWPLDHILRGIIVLVTVKKRTELAVEEGPVQEPSIILYEYGIHTTQNDSKRGIQRWNMMKYDEVWWSMVHLVWFDWLKGTSRAAKPSYHGTKTRQDLHWCLGTSRP